MYINMERINDNVIKALKYHKIKLRPKTSSGNWVIFLLPISILMSLRKPQILSEEYKLLAIISFGLLSANILFLMRLVKYYSLRISLPYFVLSTLTSILCYVYLHKDLMFSFLSGFLTILPFLKTIPFILKACPSSFTFGEACLVAQSLIIFLYSTAVNIIKSMNHVPVKVSEMSTLILQVGVTGLLLICLLSYKINLFRKTIPFYALTITVFLSILIAIKVISNECALLWILKLLTKNFRTMYVVTFWAVCTFLAALVINRQIQKGRKANTSIRKAFHFLAVLVYLTGLIDQCSILYLASGIVFALFVALEIVRILNLPPLGKYLQDGFVVFSDEKDAGQLALTPLYLMAGCSLPMWIHPENCDVTDSAGFNLLPLISGILSIGIGDTFASIIGSRYGKHKWPETNKSFEGTLGCIISQIALAYLLISTGYVIGDPKTTTKIITAIIITSLVEAKTDQVDNIILPMIMYIILL